MQPAIPHGGAIVVRLYFLTCVFFGAGLTTLAAQCVQFDVVHSVAACDVSTDEFQQTHPDEKLIQIKLPISSLVHAEESRLQFLYVVSSTTGHPFQVVDYAPKTTLMSDIEGLVSSEVAEDHSASIGIHALTPSDFPAKTDANAKLNRGKRRIEQLDRMPPKQLLSASGTMHRGLSAYFKLNPSTQTTLEGHRLFEITARVNKSWRASLLHVRCVALRSSETSPQPTSACNRQDFVVGVYLAGDEQAKTNVQKLSTAQFELQQLARTHAHSIDEQRFPTIGHKLGAALLVVKPQIPEDWLNHLLSSGDFHHFERHLPRPVRAAATEYRQARADVIDLAG